MMLKSVHAPLQAIQDLPGAPAFQKRRLLPQQVIEGAGVLRVMIHILFMNPDRFPLMFEEPLQALFQALQNPFRPARGPCKLMPVVQCILERLARLLTHVVRPGKLHGRRAQALLRSNRGLRAVRVDMAHGQTGDTQLHEGLPKLAVAASLRARVQCNRLVRLALENTAHELGQDAPRAELHEEPPPVLVDSLDFLLEEDGTQDVLGESLPDRVRVVSKGASRCIRIDRTGGLAKLRSKDGFCKGLLRVPHERCVESRRHRQRNDPVTFRFEPPLRLRNRARRTGQHHFLSGVQVCNDYAGLLVDLLPDPVHVPDHGEHASPVETGILRSRHRLAPGPRESEVIGITQHPGRPERRQLPEAVARDEIGPEPCIRENPVQTGRHGPDGRLRDLGLSQRLLLRGSLGRIEYRLREDPGRERLPAVLHEQTVHLPVHLDHGREVACQLFAHLQVLRSLS